jgi:hypothetical protein
MQSTEAQLAAVVSAAKAKQALTQTEQDGSLESVLNAETDCAGRTMDCTSDPAIDRSEAIRRLVELGLKVEK